MRSFLIVTSIVLVLAGIGGMLSTPAATETLQLVYEIQDVPAPALPSQPEPVPADVPRADGTCAPDLLAVAFLRPSAGGCEGGQCSVAVNRNAAPESASAESAEGGRRRLVVGAAAKSIGLVRGILGRERRQSRRGR
jgi:hypothetical protein